MSTKADEFDRKSAPLIKERKLQSRLTFLDQARQSRPIATLFCIFFAAIVFILRC